MLIKEAPRAAETKSRREKAFFSDAATVTGTSSFITCSSNDKTKNKKAPHPALRKRKQRNGRLCPSGQPTLPRSPTLVGRMFVFLEQPSCHPDKKIFKQINQRFKKLCQAQTKIHPGT
ncbi:hypothetical protein VX159_04660 [Dechloromonas sp. ZY10]|uniref:hypothetical protein n=1 Tax=Dechloromonas aquae TaxID=2664436 RepID=UPI003527CD89